MEPEFRTANEIRRQIGELAEGLKLAESFGEEDFASSVGLLSIRRHYEALHKELKSAEIYESEYEAEISRNPAARW